MPSGSDSSGPPVGMQILGRPSHEATLLRAQTSSRGQVPPLGTNA